jgi:uncharacterized SAM-binding protein YcdF (DUF218 family)
MKVNRNDIEKEFEKCFSDTPLVFSERIRAVVVLSYGPDPNFSAGNDRSEKNSQLVSRVRYGAELIGKLPGKPLLIFDGYDIQLSHMRDIARENGISDDGMYLLNCGSTDTANTKTQCQALATDKNVNYLTPIVIVTNRYHVPRVARTATLILPDKVDFYVLGVPGDNMSYDVKKNIESEIEKIIKYSEKGDIADYPRTNHGNH